MSEAAESALASALGLAEAQRDEILALRTALAAAQREAARVCIAIVRDAAAGNYLNPSLPQVSRTIIAAIQERFDA